MKRSEIEAVLGPVDEALVADVAATGATIDQLVQAWAWLNEDEALMNDGRSLPGAKVAELMDLLEPHFDDSE